MADTIINIKGVSKSYSGNEVFSGLDIEIEKGKITSVIGPNGCGKTTFFRLILNTTDRNGGSIQRPCLSSFGFMLEDLVPFLHLNLIQNMTAFSKLSGKKLSRKKLDEIISDTFCGSIKNRPYKNLSSGQKRKFSFALSLVDDPEILVLDEPLNSLDLKERIDMISSVKYLNKELGKTFLISSHDLNSLYDLCDEFCFIKDRRITERYFKQDITQDELTSIYLEIFK